MTNHIFRPALHTSFEWYLRNPHTRFLCTMNTCPCKQCRRRRQIRDAVRDAQTQRSGVWDLIGHPLPDEWKP